MKQKLGNERDDFGEGDDPEKWVEAETLLVLKISMAMRRQTRRFFAATPPNEMGCVKHFLLQLQMERRRPATSLPHSTWSRKKENRTRRDRGKENDGRESWNVGHPP